VYRWDFRNLVIFSQRIYFPHKPTYAYLLMFTGSCGLLEYATTLSFFVKKSPICTWKSPLHCHTEHWDNVVAYSKTKRAPYALERAHYIVTPYPYMYVSCALLEYATTLGFRRILLRWRPKLWGFPATLHFVASGTDLPAFLLYFRTAFFDEHLSSPLKTWQLCSPKSYKVFMEPSYPMPLLHTNMCFAET